MIPHFSRQIVSECLSSYRFYHAFDPWTQQQYETLKRRFSYVWSTFAIKNQDIEKVLFIQINTEVFNKKYGCLCIGFVHQDEHQREHLRLCTLVPYGLRGDPEYSDWMLQAKDRAYQAIAQTIKDFYQVSQMQKNNVFASDHYQTVNNAIC